MLLREDLGGKMKYLSTLPGVSVMVETLLLGGLVAWTSMNSDTATTLNMCNVPGSRPVTLSLLSSVTFLLSLLL